MGGRRFDVGPHPYALVSYGQGPRCAGLEGANIFAGGISHKDVDT